jgi:hydrogenase-4 membrane subunit HyfE
MGIKVKTILLVKPYLLHDLIDKNANPHKLFYLLPLDITFILFIAFIIFGTVFTFSFYEKPYEKFLKSAIKGYGLSLILMGMFFLSGWLTLNLIMG